jgi:hypothetical protein
VVVVLNVKRRRGHTDSAISERSEHPPEVVEPHVFRTLAAEQYLRQLVDNAPPLTVEQKSRLAAILAPVVAAAAADRTQGDGA